jgi:hypothetical protein
MSYTYHGSSSLIALPGEVQRVIDGNIIVIEKDYAVRKDRLPDVAGNLSPGNNMPGTQYVIDAQPQFQLEGDGFARVRLSALNVDFAEQNETITQSNVGWNQTPVTDLSVSISFSISLGSFQYKRGIYSQSQDPTFPNIIEPTILSSDFRKQGSLGNAVLVHQVTFGESKWIGYRVNRVNLYENRVFEYTVQAICAPSFVRLSSNEATVEYRLGFGFATSIVGTIASGVYYFGPTTLFGPVVTKAQEIQNLMSNLSNAEAEFEAAWRGISNVSGVRSIQFAESWRNRIELLRSQLRNLTQ